MESNPAIRSLVDEIAVLGQSISENNTGGSDEKRQELRAATKKLGFALEKPYETLERIAFWVRSLDLKNTKVWESIVTDFVCLAIAQRHRPDRDRLEALRTSVRGWR